MGLTLVFVQARDDAILARAGRSVSASADSLRLLDSDLRVLVLRGCPC